MHVEHLAQSLQCSSYMINGCDYIIITIIIIIS